MGCNQSKATDSAVVAAPPAPTSATPKVDPSKPVSVSVPSSNTTAVVVPTTKAVESATIEETDPVIPSIPTATSTKDEGDDVSVPTEKIVAAAVVKKATKAVVVKNSVTNTIEKATDDYDDAVQTLEAALSPMSASAKSTTLPSANNDNDDAVKELEETLRRLRSEDSDDAPPAEAEKKIPATQESAKAFVEEPTESVAPPAAPVAPKDINKTPVGAAAATRSCGKCDAAEKAPGAFKTCAKCRDVYYCNKACQKAHFKVHKKTCCKTESSRNVMGSNINGSAVQAN